ncbi:hypothetical protein QNN00_17000 [Bacillus velezensis]|nr:hypothetical protein [Bacillus velezensis]
MSDMALALEAGCDVVVKLFPANSFDPSFINQQSSENVRIIADRGYLIKQHE